MIVCAGTWYWTMFSGCSIDRIWIDRKISFQRTCTANRERISSTCAYFISILISPVNEIIACIRTCRYSCCWWVIIITCTFNWTVSVGRKTDRVRIDWENRFNSTVCCYSESICRIRRNYLTVLNTINESISGVRSSSYSNLILI